MFMFIESLAGERRVKVTERRTKIDWAHTMQELSAVHYPQADVIVMVMDNLNTHSPTSFYEALSRKKLGA